MSSPWTDKDYIVGEIGLNHNGSLDLALEAIEVAKRAGCDAIKFQTFAAAEFCDPTVQYEYLSQGRSITEPMIEMFQRCELPTQHWKRCVKHAKEIGIDMFTTPQNGSDLRHFDVASLPAIKVGSDDLTNTQLLAELAAYERPMIISSGMASIGDLAHALQALNWPESPDIAVLVCTSQYPTPLIHANISRVRTIAAAFPGIAVGFSDHTLGVTAAITARALGARVFEKHFTTDQSLPGPDQWYSPNEDDLSHWVTSIRDTGAVLGSGIVAPSEAERSMALIARRSLVALYDLPRGHILRPADIGMRRPGGGMTSDQYQELIGLCLTRDVAAFSQISFTDLTSTGGNSG